MYYFYAPIMGQTYHYILVAAAVIPAVLLLFMVYKSDRLEKESWRILRRLVVAGVLSTLIAQVAERIGTGILSARVAEDTTLYNVILYFVIVALSEEGAKYLLLRLFSWKNAEFNCQYDGVVYAVFVSLGFALWENISYVLSYGFSTAILRAFTAIPGHACFGVFMGLFYGRARREKNLGHDGAAKALNVFAVLVPALLHGAYDYIASMESSSDLYFIIFVAVLFGLAFATVRRNAREDRRI